MAMLIACMLAAAVLLAGVAVAVAVAVAADAVTWLLDLASNFRL